MKLGLLLLSILTVSCASRTDQRTYKTVDYDSNGQVTVQEMNIALSSAIFGIGDVNSDNRITLKEMQAVHPASTKASFQAADRDGNKSLDRPELTAAMTRLGTFDRFLKQVDANQNGIVDQEEAERLHAALSQADQAKNYSELKWLMSAQLAPTIQPAFSVETAKILDSVSQGAEVLPASPLERPNQ